MKELRGLLKSTFWDMGNSLNLRKKWFLGLNITIIGLSLGYLLGGAEAADVSFAFPAGLLGMSAVFVMIIFYASELEKRIKVEAENQRRSYEMIQARDLQLSMLPEGKPTFPGYAVAVSMKTATEVGGDYYDFLRQRDGSLITVIGDATGHGIKAGMMVAMTKTSLISTGVTAPHDMMKRMNEILRAVKVKKIYMALKIVLFKNDTMSLCSAGMPPAIIYSAESGEISETDQSALPLGSSLPQVYTLTTNPFKKGDIIVLFSDGLVEQRVEGEVPLGYEPIKSCVQKHRDSDPETIHDALKNLCNTAPEQAQLEDDITILVVKKL